MVKFGWKRWNKLNNRGLVNLGDLTFMLMIGLSLGIFIIMVMNLYISNIQSKEIIDVNRKLQLLADKLILDVAAYKASDSSLSNLVRYDYFKNGCKERVRVGIRYKIRIKDLRNNEEKECGDELDDAEIIATLKIPVSIYYDSNSINPGILIVEASR